MDNLLRRIERRFVKGVMEYGLLADGDHILVALSGGKDSLALLEVFLTQYLNLLKFLLS